MDILYVGEDLLESQILRELAAKVVGHLPEASQKMILGEGVAAPPSANEEVIAAVGGADLIIVTISNYTMREALAASEAARTNKPLILVALGPRTWAKPEFTSLGKHVRAVFVADNDQAKEAKIHFPDSLVAVTGIPIYETFAFPKFSRQEVRTKLGIAENEKFVLLPGDKDLPSNIPLAVCVLEALRTLPRPESYRVILTIHPGHKPILGQQSATDLISVYEQAFQGRNSKSPITISCKGTPFGIGTPDMVPGADIVVGINSTVLVQAAYLRIPAVAMLLAGAFDYDVPQYNFNWWAPAENGAIMPIYNMSTGKMRSLLRSLCVHDTNAVRTMRGIQEHVYPKPKKIGASYDTMLGVLKPLF